MSFTVRELDGYIEKERYTKELKFVDMSGGGDENYIRFKDENGVILVWVTSNRTKAYQNFKRKATWKFTVDYILSPGMFSNRIYIRHMRMVE